MKIIADALIINISFVLAYYLRFKVFTSLNSGFIPIFEQYSGTLIFITILWLSIFNLFGLYEKKKSDFIDESASIFASISFASLLLLGMLFLYRGFWFSRLVIVNAWVICFSLVLSNRIFFDVVRKILVINKIGLKKVIIIGAGEMGETIALKLLKDKYSGRIPVGFLDDSVAVKDVNGIKVLGKINDIKNIIKTYSINEVVFAENSIPYQDMLDIITECETPGVKFKIVPGILEIMASRIDIDELGGIPLINVSEIGLAGFNALLKRTIDIVFSSILIIILSPILILTAIVIKIDSRGPVFFFQKRVGKDGKPFYMYKFRSMVENAEDLLSGLKGKSEVEGHIFKIKKDPRLTRVGGFIRRFSVDELPQLFNVFIGDMSLVGPRPPLPDEVKNYSLWHKKRLRINPGITGIWQVSGRSLLPFEDMVRLDIYYIENWSIWMDVKILFRTVYVVLTAKGAY